MVAQPRRRFEIERDRRFAHRGFELTDKHLQLFASTGIAFTANLPRCGRDPVTLVHARIGNTRDEPNIVDALHDTGGCYAVRLVVFVLNRPTTRCLVHCALHRPGDAIGVQNRAAIEMSGSASNGLNQRSVAAQKPFLIGIKDCDE